MTTPTISTLLLVPADGDPLGLLAEGPCGARPPVAHRCADSGTWRRMSSAGCLICRSSDGATTLDRLKRDALVLAHEGAASRDGVAMLASRAGWDQYEEALAHMAHIIRGDRDLYWLQRLGILIALDPAGRDVTDEVLASTTPTAPATGRE